MTEAGGGLPLFELNASVGIDTTNFTTGITTLSTSITGLNTDVSGMLDTIDSIAAEIYANMSEVATAADTATTEITEAADALPESELENVENAFEEAKAAAEEAAKTAEEAKTGMDDAADGADEAAEELDDAVNDMDDSADEGGDGFKKFAEKVGAAWEAVKNFAATMVEVGTALVESYLEGEASDRAFNLQFGDDADAALESLERLAEYSGIYSGRITESYMAMHQAIAGSGLEQAEALEATEAAMQLAITAAAAYGLELDEASEAVQEFLRGNLEAGDAIGLNIDEETLGIWAQRMYGSEWDDLTDDQRLMGLMQFAQAAYSGEEFDAAREAQKSAVQTQLDNFNAIWGEIQAIIGEPIARELGRVTKEFNALLQDPAYQLIFENVGEVIGAVVGWVADLLISLIEWAGELEPEDVEKFLDDLKNTFIAIGSFFTDVGVVWNGIKSFFVPNEPVSPQMASVEGASGERAYALASLYAYADMIGDQGNLDSMMAAEFADRLNQVAAAFGYADATAKDFLESDEFNTIRSYFNHYGIAGYWMNESGGLDKGLPFENRDDQWTWETHGDNEIPEDVLNWINREWGESALSSSLDAINQTMTGLNTTIGQLPGMMQTAMSGVSVNVDGTVLGNLAARNMARTARSRVNTGLTAL